MILKKNDRKSAVWSQQLRMQVRSLPGLLNGDPLFRVDCAFSKTIRLYIKNGLVCHCFLVRGKTIAQSRDFLSVHNELCNLVLTFNLYSAYSMDYRQLMDDNVLCYRNRLASSLLRLLDTATPC